MLSRFARKSPVLAGCLLLATLVLSSNPGRSCSQDHLWIPEKHTILENCLPEIGFHELAFRLRLALTHLELASKTVVLEVSIPSETPPATFTKFWPATASQGPELVHQLELWGLTLKNTFLEPASHQPLWEKEIHEAFAISGFPLASASTNSTATSAWNLRIACPLTKTTFGWSHDAFKKELFALSRFDEGALRVCLTDPDGNIQHIEEYGIKTLVEIHLLQATDTFTPLGFLFQAGLPSLIKEKKTFAAGQALEATPVPLSATASTPVGASAPASLPSR
jgi:hypothetical protein